MKEQLRDNYMMSLKGSEIQNLVDKDAEPASGLKLDEEQKLVDLSIEESKREHMEGA